MQNFYTKPGLLLMALLLFCSLRMYGQTKITGNVADTIGALPGATVSNKATGKITTTDQSGDFGIVANTGDILTVSSVGYVTQHITISHQASLNIVLKADAKALNEVVVVGYGSQKKVNLTGAVSTVSGSVLEDRPIPNVGRGLQGQLPGLTVTSSSGQPGSAPTFNIWGFTSINGGSPLILVDNIETDDVANINPDDVESVTVLKDAASSAVYGSRAAFGVILITTKTGKVGAPKVTYNFNLALHKITDLPDVVTDPATVANYKNQAYYSYYGVNLYNSATVDYANARSKDPSLPTAKVDPTDPTNYIYAAGNNWFNDLYKSINTSQIHNLSVSGGTDRITYYVSADYNNQGGVFRYDADYYNRFNLRAKIDLKVTDWLHLYTNTAYNRTIYNSPSLWTSDWTSGDLYHTIGRSNTLDPVTNPDGSYTSAGVIMGFLQDGARSNTVTNQPQSTIGFTTSFFKNAFRINGDYTFRATNNYNQTSQDAVPYENGPNQQVFYAGHTDASAYADNESYQIINLYGEYEKTFGKHYFKGMVGFNQEEDSYNVFSAENDDLITNAVGYLGATTGTTPQVKGSGYQWATRGAFSRLNYIYDNKYLFELDGRYDGSSRFPVTQQYTFLPSASVGWRVSEEPFFKGLTNVINNLKFRASYGALGNDQNLGNYQFIPLLPHGSTTNLLNGIQPVTVLPPNLVSSSLTWEKIYNKTIGIDMTLFHHLDITADVYQRDTKNMITQGFQLPAVLGASQPLENAADERTKGWDLNVTYNNKFDLEGKPFTYSFRASVWDALATITRFNNPTKFWQVSGEGAYYVGMHPGEIWGLTDKGIFQSNAAAKAAPDQSAIQGYYNLNQAGEVQYADLNHDGKITLGNGTVGNPGDASVIGNTTPRYQFSGGGNFTWNNFDLSFFFQGVGKEDFYPTEGYYWSMFFAPWENVNTTILNNTWTPQNTTARFPSLKGWREGDDGPWVDLAVPQTRFMYSAAYIRLKNLTVGYSIPTPLLKKIGIDKIRVYFSGEDLWEYDKLPQGFDPEGLGGSWGSGKVYPFQREYSFGLSAKF